LEIVIMCLNSKMPETECAIWEFAIDISS